MVDLRSQYLKIKTEIDQSVAVCMDEARFIQGKAVPLFQQALQSYLGIAHVVTCGNGTDALQIALMSLGLNRGDEVLLPAFTYAATAEVLFLLGLKPVWVDVDERTFMLDVSKAESAITSRTKAIIPVHLYGQSADMEPILKMATKHNLHIVEDNAQAIGASYQFSHGERKLTGTMGHLSGFSFFPTKNLGCYGDGGAIGTNDPTLADSCRQLANHGQSEKYRHERVGINSRLDTIQAAILNVKLTYLESWIAARQQAAQQYDLLLRDIPEIVLPQRSPFSTHVFHQYTICLEAGIRDQLRKHLSEAGIPTMVYYPIPVYLQKAYCLGKYPEGSFPVSDKLSKTVLSLPMHTELDAEQQEFIAKTLKSFFH